MVSGTKGSNFRRTDCFSRHKGTGLQTLIKTKCFINAATGCTLCYLVANIVQPQERRTVSSVTPLWWVGEGGISPLVTARLMAAVYVLRLPERADTK
jgi:hypothetical protein